MKGGEPKIFSNTIIILNFEKVHLKGNFICIIDILILIYHLETKKVQLNMETLGIIILVLNHLMVSYN